jgi:hypothetical protein
MFFFGYCFHKHVIMYKLKIMFYYKNKSNKFQLEYVISNELKTLWKK